MQRALQRMAPPERPEIQADSDIRTSRKRNGIELLLLPFQNPAWTLFLQGSFPRPTMTQVAKAAWWQRTRGECPLRRTAPHPRVKTPVCSWSVPGTGILSLRGSRSEVLAVTSGLLVAVSGVCPRAEDE